VASAVRNDRGIWLARWKDASGQWRKRRATPNTRAAAKLLADEFHLQARRQESGLEALPPRDGGGTVGALLSWWLEQFSPQLASHVNNAQQVGRHLLSSELAGMALVACKTTDVRAFLERKAKSGLAPQTLNHLRSYLSRAFSRAIEVGRWTGKNPVVGVPNRRVPKGMVGDFLGVDEVPRVLRALHPRWRPLLATAVYTGLRKGELCALRKQDVDLDAHIIVVRRSWHRDTTKGGRARAVPIVPDLENWLRSALETSPSELVFPHVCATSCAYQKHGCPAPGGMMRRDVALESVLRRAMGRAGIASGWRHIAGGRPAGIPRRPRTLSNGAARSAP
jgi:integrase